MFSCFGARFAQEGQGDLPHGIESGQECCQRQRDEYHPMPMSKRIRQDLILRPETCCQQRETRQRKSTDQESPESDRHLLAQPTHVEHILRIDL